MEVSIYVEVQEIYLRNIETYTSKAKTKEKQQLIKTFAQASKVVSRCQHLNQ